jgi:hypothetical protein
LKSFRIFGVVFLDKGLRLAAENTLLCVTSIRKVMANQPRSYDFHFGEEKR